MLETTSRGTGTVAALTKEPATSTAGDGKGGGCGAAPAAERYDQRRRGRGADDTGGGGNSASSLSSAPDEGHAHLDESERSRLKKVEVAAVRVPFDGAVAVTHSGISRPQTSLLFLIAQVGRVLRFVYSLLHEPRDARLSVSARASAQHVAPHRVPRGAVFTCGRRPPE